MTTREEARNRRNGFLSWAQGREGFTADDAATFLGTNRRTAKRVIGQVRAAQDAAPGTIDWDSRLGHYSWHVTYADSAEARRQRITALESGLLTLAAQYRSNVAGTPKGAADYLRVTLVSGALDLVVNLVQSLAEGARRDAETVD